MGKQAPDGFLVRGDLFDARRTISGYEEEDIPALISELRAADQIIGYNILGFDYSVLAPYTDVNLSTLPTLDLMTYLHPILGFRPKLDSLAAATSRREKRPTVSRQSDGTAKGISPASLSTAKRMFASRATFTSTAAKTDLFITAIDRTSPPASASPGRFPPFLSF